MVDERLLDVPNLQSYFCNPVKRQDACADLDGCCSTMVLLVVWMCSRFGCRDPQFMVDTLRCVMRNKRYRAIHFANPRAGVSTITHFLLLLRAWHNGIVKVEPDKIQEWLKLKQEPGSASFRVYCNNRPCPHAST